MTSVNSLRRYLGFYGIVEYGGKEDYLRVDVNSGVKRGEERPFFSESWVLWYWWKRTNPSSSASTR